jgi:hypothetical protein
LQTLTPRCSAHWGCRGDINDELTPEQLDVFIKAAAEATLALYLREQQALYDEFEFRILAHLSAPDSAIPFNLLFPFFRNRAYITSSPAG